MYRSLIESSQVSEPLKFSKRKKREKSNLNPTDLSINQSMIIKYLSSNLSSVEV